MSLRNHVLARALLGAIVLSPTGALAALGINDEVGLNARGQVDLDGFGAQPQLSLKDETEVIVPFTRSAVSVADAQTGLFEYAGSADIGTQKLAIFGSLVNSTGAAYFGGGVPILQVVTEVRDVLTFSSTLGTSYDVTLQLTVTGDIVLNSAAASSNSLLDFGPAPGSNTTDSARYTGGPISDTLSVTRTFSGTTATADLTAFLSFNVERVEAGGSVTGQLSNTATLNLILPAGVSLASSQSGTFGQVIPEPAEYAFMLAGLAALGLVARRRV
jgi:hypothetical protein